MDYRHFVAFLIYIFGTWSTAISNSTVLVTPTTTTTPKETDDSDDDRLFGNPFWLGFTVILFICLLVISLVVSLTFGIYKYRQHAKKRGLYRDKNRIYNEHDENTSPDYTIFQTEGVTNATYIGSS
ncbi:uncharacterized protein LOC132748896 [Ruditapes philippinarum]|uniref:uncharacterized protein LOC132748896 n=1 Tax=Ruditapes philippinarum TaxID=129788 RepID=UPI00295C0C75|nr:uncharacterized protein LOC132748896 [Ruditapes philippinarum]